MPAPDLRDSILSTLAAFADKPLREAAVALLSTLGYQSDRTLELPGSKPQAFLDLIAAQSAQARFDEIKALFADWKSSDILFQLTDEELSSHSSLFKDTAVKTSLLQSYLFFAIELKGKDYARGKLTGLARQINRVFPMPVMVLMRHGDLLSIAVINRRQNKVQADKDVLEKVTLIRDISLAIPHRGHLDILASFAVPNLVHPKKLPIQDFDTLHAAWEQIFNIELLNERFYKELSNWYFWALQQVEFPPDLEPDDEKRRATGLIRLLTRLIFCWFLKEKGLIPENLFHPTDLAKILKGFDPESETSSTYYQAILQNLFFATLNQRMGKDGNGKPYRVFAKDESFTKNRTNHGADNLYRYESQFTISPDEVIARFSDIPFLNGGLFERLDPIDDSGKQRYLDGFSRNAKKRPHVPDRLFFDSGETADLSSAYGDKKRSREKVTGLITILNRYKFTIVENTPIDQEIALDPELLGKVFENLLASYNKETEITARKQTGSFYTPRPIVDYMVDECLKAHLTRALVEKAQMKESEASSGLDILFAYTEKMHAFSPSQVATLITSINALKILDPACGSGAFPMGVLHKLVYILGKLDERNEKWCDIQIERVQATITAAEKIDDAAIRNSAIADLQKQISSIQSAFADNELDYGRKLYLIENCLYGVDIQPIAIQITKLRFFISLVCDQKTNQNKAKNHNIKPLPNLETKFVAADTLIGLPIPEPDLFIKSLIDPIEKEIEQAYHSHFDIQRRDQKLALQKRIKSLRLKLSDTIVNGLGAGKNADVTKKAQHVAEWDAFDPQATADFFDPHWMFGRSLAGGFDIVIGNPPYVFGGNIGISAKDKKRYKDLYVSGAGKTNLFVIFIERGAQLLRKNGLLSYILPNTLLRVTSYDSTRRLVLSKYCIEEILDLDVGVFDQVTASTIAIRIRASTPDPEWTTVIRHGLDDPSDKSCKQADWKLKGGIIDIFSTQRDREILDLIEAGSEPLGGLCHRIRFGVVISGNLSEVVSNQRHGNRWMPFLEGDEIGPYSINYRGRFLNYDESLLHRSRTPDVFECRKIMIQRITGGQTPLKAALDDKSFYNKESILNLILNDPYTGMYCFILALINSKTANWFYRKRFTNDSKLTVNLSKEYVGQIPVKIPPDDKIVLFDRLVRLLMHAKCTDELAAGQFLEDLIDACVMECYFRKHMEERDLLFLDTVAPYLTTFAPKANSVQMSDFLTNLNQTLNAPSHPIRNRLLRLTADSPNLLGIIKGDGRV